MTIHFLLLYGHCGHLQDESEHPRMPEYDDIMHSHVCKLIHDAIMGVHAPKDMINQQRPQRIRSCGSRPIVHTIRPVADADRMNHAHSNETTIIPDSCGGGDGGFCLYVCFLRFQQCGSYCWASCLRMSSMYSFMVGGRLAALNLAPES